MKIPSAEHHFQKPTAVVVFAKDKAHLYLGDGDQFEYTDEVVIDDSFVPGAGVPGFSDDDTRFATSNQKHLVEEVDARLKELLQGGEITAVWVVVGHEHKNEIVDAMSKQVAEKIEKTIPKDLFGLDDAMLLEAITKA